MAVFHSSIVQIAVLVLFILSNCRVSAQVKDSILIKARWNKGDLREMIVKPANLFIDGIEQATPSDTTSAKLFLIITDKKATGYLVDWKVQSDIDGMDEDEYQWMKDFFTSCNYVIETDTNGQYIQLVNWKELLEQSEKIRQLIYAEAEKEGVAREIVDQLIGMFLPATKEGIEQECNSLTGIFHGIYGTTVVLNDTISEATIIENPYISEGLPATLQTICKKIDDERIVIKYVYIYDYVKINELMQPYLPGQNMDDQNNDSYTECIFNTRTGWLEKVSLINEFTSGASSMRTEIEYIFK